MLPFYLCGVALLLLSSAVVYCAQHHNTMYYNVLRPPFLVLLRWHENCTVESKEEMTHMKIAIPVWGDNVGTTFDFAHHLLLVDVNRNREEKRNVTALPDEHSFNRARRLSGLKVDVLICGAISQQMFFNLANSGINIVPFVKGDVEQVLSAFLSGRLAESRFLLPGCPPDARADWKKRRF